MIFEFYLSRKPVCLHPPFQNGAQRFLRPPTPGRKRLISDSFGIQVGGTGTLPMIRVVRRQTSGHLQRAAVELPEGSE